jgi:hypothetical protein
MRNDTALAAMFVTLGMHNHKFTYHLANTWRITKQLSSGTELTEASFLNNSFQKSRVLVVILITAQLLDKFPTFYVN